jgi:hypothetical protein
MPRNTHVDPVFEETLKDLIAVWASELNPTQDPRMTSEMMDRLGWLIVSAGSVSGDVPIMEIGHALRDEANGRGFESELL